MLAVNKINLISVLVEFIDDWTGFSHIYYKLLILEIILGKERLGSKSKAYDFDIFWRHYKEKMACGSSDFHGQKMSTYSVCTIALYKKAYYCLCGISCFLVINEI